MKRNIILFIILIYSIGIVAAQNEMNKDSLTQELRGYTMRNFTQARTFSLQWETRFSHNYSVSNNGSIQESGKKQNIHHINFSAMLPLLRRNKLSIHIGINYKSYNFDLQSQESFHSSFSHKTTTIIFRETSMQLIGRRFGRPRYFYMPQ